MAKRINVPTSVKSNAYSFMNWDLVTDTSSKQYQLIKQYGKKYKSINKVSGFGYVHVNGVDRLAVAMTPKFGTAGDCVDIYMSDGKSIQAVLADIKGNSKEVLGIDYNEWGHIYGVQTGVIEVVTSWKGQVGPPGWKNMFNLAHVSYVINQGTCLNGKTPSNAQPSENVGKKVVEIARKLTDSKYVYVEGGYMYNNENKGVDAPGLVYYSYKEAGVEMSIKTVDGYYRQYSEDAKVVSINEVASGDLLFYKTKTPPITINHIAIANGSGGRIHATSSSGIVEETGLGGPDYILRILSDAETDPPDKDELDTRLAYPGTSAVDYVSLTSNDPNSMLMSSNLSKVGTAGYDYGYLIDMTHGRDFKFYIPEFTEQAGANWSPIDLRGRSVQVYSYDSTNSRNINISLDLYAGEGLYKPTSTETGEDAVTRLHDDANFLKSLEYPDYSVAIARPPSTVHLILGSAVSYQGVVSNVTVEHLKPLDSQNRAMYLKVNFTVSQIAINPPDYSDIRGSR